MFRYILLLVFTLISFTSYSQFSTEEIKRIRKELPKNLLFNYDEFDQTLWISSKGVNLSGGTTFPDDRRTFTKLYFGLSKNSSTIQVMPLRIINRTYRDGWIFFKKVSFLVGNKSDRRNGTAKTYSLTDNKTKRKNLVGSWVTEKSDILVDENIKSFIKEVIETKKEVRVRFSGSEGYYEEKAKEGKFSEDFKPLMESFEKLNKRYE